MDNEVVPKKKIVKYKHLLFGVIILISGMFLGLSSGIYLLHHNADFFRPPPRKFSENITNQIVKDYPVLAPRKDELNSIIYNKLQEFHELNEEISYRILQLQHNLAEDVAKCLPTKEDKDRWMNTFPEYFPGHQKRIPRARRFEERLECEPGECKIKKWHLKDEEMGHNYGMGRRRDRHDNDEENE